VEDTQSNRPDDLGDISDSGLILSKAKLVLAGIRHETVPAHIRDHAVQRPETVTPPNLAAVGELLDLLADWVPDSAARDRVLVANAHRLYGFGNANA